MRKFYKKIISFILVLSMLFCMSVSTFAAGEAEEYISELRLIYAEDYDEALEILSEGEFRDYKLLDENLNANSDEIGVWLAYKTTTDIDDAITDLAVMQMNGGYNIGNYQEMIKESFEEYLKMGENYLKAIEYFAEAYDAGDFMADAAFRQLNLYNVVSLGIPNDKIPDFEGERLGDIFYDGIDEEELATMFMQGNSYALKNIRSLLAMGVSYNEDGMHYLEKVAEAAAAMGEDEYAFEDDDDYEDFDTIAAILAGTLLTFKNMFKELALYEDELNYEDDELTELEAEYAEYKSIADRLREVEYLDGETLYDFCLDYKLDDSDFTPLYPLVAAMNPGQRALTKVKHYYDVVRYSMSEYPEEMMNEMIAEQEAIYGDMPFNVYTGVDRSIYYGSFALTNEAYRADAYTESGFLDFILREEPVWSASTLLSAAGTVGFGIWAIRRTIAAKNAADQTAAELSQALAADKAAAIAAAKDLQLSATKEAIAQVSDYSLSSFGSLAKDLGSTYNDAVNALINKYFSAADAQMHLAQSFDMKLYAIGIKSGTGSIKLSMTDAAVLKGMNSDLNVAITTKEAVARSAMEEAQSMTDSVTSSMTISGGMIALYVVSGVMLLYSAFSLGMTVYNYYHPDYTDVPLALVDVTDTVDGDRYIKYDVVYNAETNEDGVYEAGDLNAFEGKRWNALYYTKNYEAGKPLLADGFTVSNNNNKPKEGYTPVHRFGEVVCYDLNKYNFDGDTQIYLSVKQSKNDKSAVKDVPDVVGSMFGTGSLFLAGGVGVIAGVGGVLATQEIIKKKKSKEEGSAPAAEETSNE
jgi:hypothetical protein